MATARICIITPGHLGSNPRVVKEADALTDAGYAVRVVAADIVPWVRDRDADVLKDRRWRCERVDAGSRLGHGFRRVRRFLSRLAIRQIRDIRVAVWAYSSQTDRLARAAAREAADLYIAHYIAALPAAAAAADIHGGKMAFDAEDLHSGEFPLPDYESAEAQSVRLIEQHLLPRCSYISAASPGIARGYSERYSIPQPTVILNVFSRGAAPPSPSPAGEVKPGPSLYWFSQTIGPDRGLEVAVAALARARSKPHLYLRGTCAAGYRNKLLGLAITLGVEDRIHFLPPGLPSEMERLASPYDLGLVSETGQTENRAIALTNKIFTFLLAGIPVAASAIPAHLALAEKLPLAVTLYETLDPDALATCIDKMISDPGRLKASRAEAWQSGQTWLNWETERMKLVGLVRQALA